MSYMFSGCTSLSYVNLSYFDTSNVTNMKGMFENCGNLNEIFVSRFDTTLVKDMSYMFSGCVKVNNLDTSRFNTSNVTNMEYMFSNCRGLKTLELSSFNTEKVTNMSNMFEYCIYLTELDLQSFNTKNVKKLMSMFKSCGRLKKIIVDNFTLKSIWKSEYTKDMFDACNSLKGGNGTAYSSSRTNGLYAHYDTDEVPGYFTTQNNKLFVLLNANNGYNDFNISIYNNNENINLPKNEFNVRGKVFDYWSDANGNMYFDEYNVDISNNLSLSANWIDGDGVIEHDLYSILQNEYYKEMVKRITFSTMSEINDYDSVETLDSMQLKSYVVYNGNLNYELFVCYPEGDKLILQDGVELFNGFVSLEEIIGLDAIDVENTKDLHNMFKNCSSLKHLDLRSFKTYNVENISSMFENCSNLNFIIASESFVTDKINSFNCGKNVFLNCSLLKGENGTKCDGINNTLVIGVDCSVNPEFMGMEEAQYDTKSMEEISE